ncbi:MAG: hypothetical protein WD313_04175 [Acidimicrobiia bacterium]
MRRLTFLLLASLLVLGVTQTALATKPGSVPGAIDGHKITICHATNSASNPYVVITIDVAAWNPGDDHGHSPDNHVNSKTGDRDKVWNETTGCDEPTTTTAPTTTTTGPPV